MTDKNHPVEENELLGWAEQKIGNLKPYSNQIIIGIVLVVAAFASILLLLQARQTSYANQWRELNIAYLESNQNQSSGRLLEVADSYPDQPSGNWSLMLAGDYDLRTGLQTLATDRTAGFKLIEKASESFARIVETGGDGVSTDLRRRALFSLAYAEEALGKFTEAAEHYGQLVEAADDTAYGPAAVRGLARSSDPAMQVAYEEFVAFEDPGEDIAPGPTAPTRPSIETPDLDFDNEGETTESGTDGASDTSTEGGEKEGDPTGEIESADGSGI